MLRYFFSVSVNAFSGRSLFLCCISFSPALRMGLNRTARLFFGCVIVEGWQGDWMRIFVRCNSNRA